MGMTRYERISGGFIAALSHMNEGKEVFTERGMQYKTVENGCLYFVTDAGGMEYSKSNFNQLNTVSWYIKKPFDVRQAMRDKPDEWVGAFKTSENDWVKVGFDTSEFTVVGLELSNDAPIGDAYTYFVVCVYGMDLDRCIPIDEVPADER